MSNPLTFYKMHSLGNDFMVVDAVREPFSADPAAISIWANRNLGIGFDQLLCIGLPEDDDVDFDYQIFNADGSRSEQCGNGTRCVALLARKTGLTNQNVITWSSLGGRVSTEFKEGGIIETRMPGPSFDRAQIPFEHPCTDLAVPLEAAGQTFSVIPVSIGNPHAVVFLDEIQNLDVAAIGGELTHHPAFPNRANVGFCQVVNESFMRLRVYERGVGETQACGTGACAAGVAAMVSGRGRERIKISLPGGKLRVEWPDKDGAIQLSGDATLVYRGQMKLDEDL